MITDDQSGCGTGLDEATHLTAADGCPVETQSPRTGDPRPTTASATPNLVSPRQRRAGSHNRQLCDSRSGPGVRLCAASCSMGGRAAGAAAGSSNRAFSEKWERPSWLVYWSDGRTLQVLMDLAAALGRYRVGGAPLPFERLRVHPRQLRGRAGSTVIAHHSRPRWPTGTLASSDSTPSPRPPVRPTLQHPAVTKPVEM